MAKFQENGAKLVNFLLIVNCRSSRNFFSTVSSSDFIRDKNFKLKTSPNSVAALSKKINGTKQSLVKLLKGRSLVNISVVTFVEFLCSPGEIQ